MGYAKSPHRVERMKPYLNAMVNATAELRWKSNDAHMLAYHIREALGIAKKLGIAPYAKLKDEYIIKNLGTIVCAVRRIESAVEAGGAKLTLADIETVEEIVGACIIHSANEMYFPDADLDNAEAKVLYRWAETEGYFIVVGENGTTVTRSNPGEAAWKPE